MDYENSIFTDFGYVSNYFGFGTFSMNTGKGGMNEEFYIQGKIRKSNVKTFFIFSMVILIFFVARSYEVTKNFLPIFLTFIITLILLFIRYKILFRKSKIKEKVDFYNRQLPSNLKPAHVRMLLKDGVIDQISLAATLLDLIDRGYLTIDNVERKREIFATKVNITISRTPKSLEGLLEFEKFVIYWFIDICGNGNKISSIELNKCLKTTENFSPNAYFSKFKSLVMLSFPILEFYKKNKNKNFIYFIFVLVFFAGMIINPNFIFYPLLIFFPIYGLGGLMFLLTPYLLKEKGFKEIRLWKSLKMFLDSFSNINKRTVEEINLWDYYIPYAVCLDSNDASKTDIYNFFGKDINRGYERNNYNKEEVGYGESLELNKKIIDKINEETKKYNFHSYL